MSSPLISEARSHARRRRARGSRFRQGRSTRYVRYVRYLGSLGRASRRAVQVTRQRAPVWRRAAFSRYVLAWLAAYLYGSLPLVYWLGRRSGVNLRKSGSGNVGVSNLLSSGKRGRRWAVPAALFDASKGYLPISICRRLGYPREVAELAGVCGVMGQCWPLFLRFNGGRGLSAFFGAALQINRRAGVLALSTLASGVLWRLGSLLSHHRAPMQAARWSWAGSSYATARSKVVPLSGLAAILLFTLVCLREHERTQRQQLIPPLLAALLLLRRLTAPLPDDAEHGPTRQPSALLYRLLYDRNTPD
ncbi:MAG: glycerol-3-phosphate acyltransferase [Thermogemmatispora sp.]|uniref:glycerol-3-phosphate acyltransferase n=1 Tax=Thermogemmatispora sp. TaxID=1968838 RepID=UPI0019D9EF62|nr:glycerol-3-phosphate acyltransferase [Thermogemmatispora sp.]MBE3564538.1 glycerol-3-phosphate acyltransferase [Thermogemmatispora sp.]